MPADSPIAETPPSPRRRDVARVASLAEAGYLVSLLESHGAVAASRPDESFNAVNGAWNASFLVSVAEDDVAEAARLLHQEAKLDSPAPEALEDRSLSPTADEGQPSGLNPWRVLTVLAVAATCLGWAVSRRAAVLPPRGVDRPEAEPFAALAGPLAEAGGFVSASPRGDGAPSRLRYAPRQRLWVLSTDEDGDGRYETHRRFVAPVAGVAGAR